MSTGWCVESYVKNEGVCLSAGAVNWCIVKRVGRREGKRAEQMTSERYPEVHTQFGSQGPQALTTLFT